MISRILAFLVLLSALAAPAAALEIKSDPRPGAVPSLAAPGEIAINRADGRLFYKDQFGVLRSGSLVEIDINGCLHFRVGLMLGCYQGGTYYPLGDISGTPFKAPAGVNRSLGTTLRTHEPAEALGAGGRGQTDDTAALQAAIDAAIADGRRGLTLAAGARYALTTGVLGSNGAPAVLKIVGATDFTLDCQGSTLLLKAPASGAVTGYGNLLRIEGGARVTIDRCAFDYVNLPFTQGTLASINTSAKTATFTLDPAFPVAWDRVNVIEGYDPATGMATSYVIQGGNNRAATVSGNSMTVNFSATDDQPALSTMSVGASYIIARQKYGGDAISTEGVDGFTLRRSPIYATAGMGVHAFDTRDVTIEDGSGPILKGGRWRSINADALHFTDVRGRLIVRGNTIEGMGDDAFNAYPLGRTVASVSGGSFTISQPVPATLGFSRRNGWRAGDTLTLVSAGGVRLGSATITTLSLSGDTLTVGTTGLPAGTAQGSYVYNSSASPHTTITGNTFRRIHGAAAMLQIERGDVFGNTVDGVTSEAFSVGGPYWSFFNEGGLPVSVSVHDNDINNANNGPPNVSYAGGAITAFRTSPDRTENNPPAGLLGSVSIRNNRIRNTRGPCVYASSVASLDLGPNTCDAWALNPDAGALFGRAAHAFVIFNVGAGRLTPGTLLNRQTVGLRGYLSAADSAAVAVAHPTSTYFPFVYAGYGYDAPDDATFVGLHAGGTVANLNMTLPRRPVDQQRVAITTDQAITTLNLYPAANQSLVGAPTTLPQYGRVEFYWSQQYTTWFRVQ